MLVSVMIDFRTSSFPRKREPRWGGVRTACPWIPLPRDDRTTIRYYRQIGLNVHLIASRWAQAMREISGRLEETPGEEGFPAYLDSSIKGVYESAGALKTNDGLARSLTNDRHRVARRRQLRRLGDAIGARNSGDLSRNVISTGLQACLPGCGPAHILVALPWSNCAPISNSTCTPASAAALGSST